MVCKWNDSFSLKNSNQEARREGRMRRGLYCSERKVKVTKRKEKIFKRTKRFFTVEEWPTDPDFCAMREFVRNFRVVNDVAENAIQMVTDYTEKITKSETQRKFLLAGTVPQQRRDNSDLRRKVLQPTGKLAKSQEKHKMLTRNS